MAEITKKGRADLYIFLLVVGLMMFSLAAVYSASSTFALYKTNDFNTLFKKHFLMVIVSIIVLFIALKMNYHIYFKWTKKVMFLAIGLLIVVLFLGTFMKGANRWLSLGPLSLQPSEVGKYALIFHLSVLLANKEEYISDFKKGFLPLLFWIGIVVGLVFLQPNFSTGFMIFLISFAMMFVGKVRLLHIGLILLSGIPVIALYAVSAKYRMDRILSFFGKGHSEGLENVGYQLQQAIIGFGNGGFWGVGPGESHQRDLFLPESYGDFIYSIIGEEYGYIGAVIIMAVFCFLMIRGFKIAKRAPDNYGKYLAVGITSSVSLYAFINAGVASGLLPTTGLPMPFLSFGGTSMIFTAFAVGVLLNISTFTDIRPKEEKEKIIEEKQEPIVGQVFN